MLHGGKNFRKFDQRLSFTEATIDMFLETSCMLHDTQIISLSIVLLRVPRLKIFKLFIKGILEKLGKLNKSNPWRCISSSNSKKTNFAGFWTHGLGLCNGGEETPFQQFLLSCLYVFDSIFSSIVWIDKLHKCVERICFSI